MPQERNSQFPFATAADAAASSGGREIKAARNIVSRRIDGIPKRGYIMGDCDPAPVVKGVADFAEAVYALLDSLENMDPLQGSSSLPGDVKDAAAEVHAMMEDHRCPPATVAGEDA